MTSTVYNEGLEIACKASDGKSIAAFPDVCKTHADISVDIG